MDGIGLFSFAVKYVGYYIPVVLFTFAPWSLLLPFALKRFRTDKNEDRVFILSWFWCVFAFFTLASFKHTHYMLLLSVPLAMIAASFFENAKKGFILRRSPIIIALATVAIINFIPVWNDFWFALILIRSDHMKTVPLATASLYGQYVTQYGLVFAVLTLATIPVILFYLILSRQFVEGLSSGAFKG